MLTSVLLLMVFQVTSVIARKYFESGEISLETAAKDLDSWPLPSPGHTSELPLMGHLFHLVLPSQSTRSVESGCETVTLVRLAINLLCL